MQKEKKEENPNPYDRTATKKAKKYHQAAIPEFINIDLFKIIK
jgi:hypothetical protein